MMRINYLQVLFDTLAIVIFLLIVLGCLASANAFDTLMETSNSVNLNAGNITCGDHHCDSNESCSTCSADCGICKVVHNGGSDGIYCDARIDCSNWSSCVGGYQNRACKSYCNFVTTQQCNETIAPVINVTPPVVENTTVVENKTEEVVVPEANVTVVETVVKANETIVVAEPTINPWYNVSAQWIKTQGTSSWEWIKKNKTSIFIGICAIAGTAYLIFRKKDITKPLKKYYFTARTKGMDHDTIQQKCLAAGWNQYQLDVVRRKYEQSISVRNTR